MILRAVQIGLWAFAGAAAVGAGLLWTGVIPPRVETVQAPAIGGEFSLTDHQGQPRTWADFRGKATAVFFGFTNCPDVCPTTLGEMTVMLQGLGPTSDRFNVVLITVDPARDTVPVLRDYMAAFDERIIALTGSEAEIDKAVKAFKVFRAKSDHGGDTYSVDHTAVVLLFDDDGNFAGTLDRHDKAEDQQAKIKRLIET